MRFTLIPNHSEVVVADLEQAGHTYVENLTDADFLVFDGGPADLPLPLPENIGFVQAQFAGVDPLHSAGVLKKSGVRWANAAGLYADTVAESCLALLLAVLHLHKEAGLTGSFDTREEISRRTRFLTPDTTVAVIGAGGIGRRLIELLAPFRCRTIAVNRSGRSVPGATETVAVSEAERVWEEADAFILLMPVTEESRGLVDAEVLGKMKPNAVIVNAGRGPLIVTDDLVEALRSGEIAGAGLDVTDPEPLPAGHPLWAMPNVVITPHTANPSHNVEASIGALAARNAELFAAGERMATEVDLEIGY
ncbi:MAG TPA: D-isomer specific 2-hydroxyacid dehydrogenase family protein [Corynebacterium sp.]|nr:D-isomer specific 2-hydroxyacid dehydrogenase family protein [Corynebacterium sp.]